MKYLRIYFLFVICPAFCLSQNEMDSLKKLLERTPEDTNRVNLLFQLSEFCDEQDIGRYAGEALALARKLGFKKGTADALSNVAFYETTKDETEKAITDYFEALRLYEEMNDHDGIARCQNNLAYIYSDQSKKDLAFKYFNLALGTYRRINHQQGISYALSNIASVLDDMKQYDEAIKVNLQSLEIKKTMGDTVGMAGSYNNIADCYLRKKEIEKAVEFFHVAEQLYRKKNYKTGICRAVSNLSVVYERMGDAKNAIAYGKEAYRMAVELNSQESIKRSAESLASAYAMAGQYKEAYEYHLIFYTPKDSIFNAENSRQVTEIQTKYDTEKKDKELILANADAREKSLQRNAFIVGFALMAVLLFFIFRSYRQKKKDNIEIRRQKHVIEEKQKEILDSIHYAKRIQRSLLANEKYIHRHISRLKGSNH